MKEQDFLSEEHQAKIRAEIEKNLDFYVANAYTAEQIIALNKIKRESYKRNKSLIGNLSHYQ